MKRIYFDMDGTLAAFTPVGAVEELYEPGFFAGLAPQENVVGAARELIERHGGETEVFVLTGCLEGSGYAAAEKREWLGRHLPQLGESHVFYVPCGERKGDVSQWRSWQGGGLVFGYAFPGPGSGGREAAVSGAALIDDYSPNLFDWEGAGGTGIKLMNGINGTHGTWEGARVDFRSPPSVLAENILALGEERAAETAAEGENFMVGLQRAEDHGMAGYNGGVAAGRIPRTEGQEEEA